MFGRRMSCPNNNLGASNIKENWKTNTQHYIENSKGNIIQYSMRITAI